MDEKKFAEYAKKLPRERFMTDEYKAYAQDDRPFPIGYGQTISQPSLVWQMTALLDPEKQSRVLEIGTGSGYQTALIAAFCQHVYTVELVRELSERAQKTLQELRFENVSYRVGDGSNGWPEHAPYDRIMVTAAAGKTPSDLIDQLAVRGRMIIPVGPHYVQDLLCIDKDANGKTRMRTVEKVRFVEMKGKYGWDQE